MAERKPTASIVKSANHSNNLVENKSPSQGPPILDTADKQLEFILLVMKHTPGGKPNYQKLAEEFYGEQLKNGPQNVQRRLKSIVETNGYLLEKGKVVVARPSQPSDETDADADNESNDNGHLAPIVATLPVGRSRGKARATVASKRKRSAQENDEDTNTEVKTFEEDGVHQIVPAKRRRTTRRQVALLEASTAEDGCSDVLDRQIPLDLSNRSSPQSAVHETDSIANDILSAAGVLMGMKSGW